MQTTNDPEWVREKYLTKHFGLTHTILFRLRVFNLVRTLSLKQEGDKQGARLYHLGSVREYLKRQEMRGKPVYYRIARLSSIPLRPMQTASVVVGDL